MRRIYKLRKLGHDEPVAPEPQHALDEEITYINLQRVRVFALILFILHIALLVIDMGRLAGGVLARSPGYFRLFLLHLVLEVGLLVFLLLSFSRRPAQPSGVTNYHRAVTLAFSCFLLLIAAGISSVDQLIHGEITVYVIAILAIATGAYLNLPASLFIFGVSYAVFMIGISLFQGNPDKRMGHYVNGTLLTIVGFFLARMIYAAFSRDFMSRKIIEKQKEELERQSREDSLTGLFNRRYMDFRLTQEFDRARRYRHPLSVAMGDIDFFKKVNDEFSHRVGDEVLKRFAQVFLSNLRSSDVVSRYGGEEFLIIFPETELEKAAIVCEKIRRAVEGYTWDALDPELKVTISLGVAGEASHPNYERMVLAADEKLYEAKHLGRNRVCR